MNLKENPSGKLLIVPEGIEMKTEKPDGTFEYRLLIVPEGIEIGNILTLSYAESNF